jgi:hypothetical protein
MTVLPRPIDADVNSVFRVNATAATAIHHAHGDIHLTSMQEVWDWTAEHKPHDLQHLRVFCDVWGYGPAHLLTLEVDRLDEHTPAPRAFDTPLEWFDASFPKSSRGRHPRADLAHVSLARYKKVREGVRRCVRGAMGAYAARIARDDRHDGWRELLDLFEPLIGGPLSRNYFGLIKKLADIGRRAEIEPWDLADEDAVEHLEAALVTQDERQTAIRAIGQINGWIGILEFGDLLPPAGLPPLPARRMTDPLPAHIARRVEELTKIAATRIDINTSEAHDDVSKSTRDAYRSALSYHLRLLPHCERNAEIAYDHPVTDLDVVDDVDRLLDPEHISATIRATQDREHLPTAVQRSTALGYYETIALVLSKHDAASGIPAEIKKRLKSSEYFKGCDRDEMPEHIQAWCLALLDSEEKQRRFWNLNRIFHAKAERIIAPTRDETGKFDVERLKDNDRQRVVRLGVCAAVTAIIIAGRPLRLRNALWLRHRGRRANIVPRKDWKFFVPAEEAKAGKKISEIALRRERDGPQIMDWYLHEIRPLLDPQGESIHLFPSIQKTGGRINPSTFGIWFQAAVNDADLVMTFHRFRTGLAVLLVRRGVPMRQIADLLANTETTCRQRYAFLDPDRSAKASQDAMVAAAAEVENIGSAAR